MTKTEKQIVYVTQEEYDLVLDDKVLSALRDLGRDIAGEFLWKRYWSMIDSPSLCRLAVRIQHRRDVDLRIK